MHETTVPHNSTSMPARCHRHPLILLALGVMLATGDAAATRAADAPSAPVGTNPLRKADPEARAAALNEAWTTYQRSCQPCHGSIGAGDGPYATAFPKRAADLRRPSRDIATDAIRFTRIRDGAATLRDRAWESNMPAFGDEFNAAAIWGLVALLEDFAKEGSGIDSGASSSDMYAARCAACHGAGGAGDGPLAPELLPPPRDFVHGAYRARSTAYGQAPLDSDLIGTTAHGVGSTAMGRFVSLGIDRLEDLAHHLMSFNPKLFEGTPATISMSRMPALATDQLATRGRAVYGESKCGECHGAAGRGDGPAATTLKDDEGHPSIATNLTQRWKFKIGTGTNDVFRTLTSGLNGTPMKGYSSLSSDDRWALAYYLDRIARTRPRAAASIPVTAVSDAIPFDVAHPLWRAAVRAEIPMSPQLEIAPHWARPAIDVVGVAAAANKDELGMLIVWDDPTRNVRTEEDRASTVPAALARHGTWKLTDAIAVEFPNALPSDGSLPPSLLGDERHPVRRWYWAAERQERGDAEALVQLIAGPRATPASTVEQAPVRTTARYEDGQWRVLMITNRPTAGPTKSLPLAFQAWDGGAGESGNWMSTSPWIRLTLE